MELIPQWEPTVKEPKVVVRPHSVLERKRQGGGGAVRTGWTLKTPFFLRGQVG